MRSIILYLLCALLCLSMISCRNQEDESQGIQVTKPEKLVVYLNGIGSTGEDGRELYPTSFTIGPRAFRGVITASEGNIFKQALEEYEEKTGIQIEIHYLDEYGKDKRFMLQELYEDGEDMPDLVIASKHHTYDYYNMISQGLLLDLTPYIENDEARQDDDLYYQKVLDAGKIKGQQYIIPLTFNLNALITSEEYLQRIGMQLPEENVSYEDVIYLLNRSCEEMQQNHGIEAIYDSSFINSGQYIMDILLSSAYSSYFGENVDSIRISEKVLAQINELMGKYIKQEYTNVYGYETMSFSILRRIGGGKKMYVQNMMSGQDESIGIFLTGGRGGGTNEYHNILTDAAYFNSVYQDRDTSMVMKGIPTYENDQAYSANVDTMMFSFADCQYPEAVYDLMCYLMDYPLMMEAGLSINREITEKQLEDVQNTFISVYPDELSWNRMLNGMMTKDEIQKSMIQIEPLNEKSVETIRFMLDHMESAGVSYYPLEGLLLNRVLNEIGEGTMTSEEAAEWTLARLRERKELFESQVIFYDEQYEYNILGWEIPE